MSTIFDWTHDFCLSCDKQTADGPYCSQACRLADLEHAGTSSRPLSPVSYSWSSAASSPTSISGFHLPPPINFAAYKSTTRVESIANSPPARNFPNSFYSAYTTIQPATPWSTLPSPTFSPNRGRRLTSSSSRSSLSSMRMTTPSQTISEETKLQLQDYTNSFDKVRDLKRRITIS